MEILQMAKMVCLSADQIKLIQNHIDEQAREITRLKCEVITPLELAEIKTRNVHLANECDMKDLKIITLREHVRVLISAVKSSGTLSEHILRSMGDE